MAKKGKALLVVGLAALVIGAGAVGYAGQALRPMPTGPSKYVRYETAASLALIFHDLEQQGIVRDGRAARVYARLKGAPQPIAPGTYQVAPGMTVDQIIAALKKPVQRMVRIPEGHWISRVA
ncbi:MAG: endolytic transglycosylase MltG, partial [Fimbriimonadaceae bacterium]